MPVPSFLRSLMASLLRYTLLWFSVALASIFATEGNSDSVQLGLVFTSEPQDVVVLRGEPYVYDCSALSLDGERRPANITWRRDGKVINDARHYVLKNGSLYFTRIVRRKHGLGDEGFYECLARNSGGAILSRRAHLTVATVERREAGRTVAAVEGELVRLPCNMKAVPATTAIWQRDRQDLPQDPRYTLLPSNTLQIMGVMETDSGQYRCNVTNIAGTKFSREDELLVERPKGPPGRKPPDMYIPANYINTKVGATETLECAASGLPLPTLTWTFQNDDPIDLSDPKYAMIGRGNLQIRNIQARDAARYKCTATNPMNPSQSISAITTLIVHEPPVIRKKSDSKLTRFSDTVRIYCEFSGKPKPTVLWYHNGNHLEQRGSESNMWLITYADKRHEGYYQCRARNDAGQVTSTMRLKVEQSESTPDKPRNVKAIVQSPTSLLITWDPVSAKNGEVPMGYSVHYANVETPDEELQRVATVNAYILDSLPPYTNISIYVIAYAKSNTSPHSDTIYQITGESIPLAAPKASVSPIGATSLKVTWEPLPMNQARGKITEYEIHYRVKDSSTYTAERVQGNTFEYTLSGLEPNRAYDVRILAGTRLGFPELPDADWPWVTAYTNTQLDVLEPPILQVHALNSTAVQARWRPVNENQRSISGYKLKVYSKTNTQLGNIIYVSSERNATITALEPDTLYKISIQCVGHVGSHEKVEPTVREVKTLKIGEPVVQTNAPPPPQELHATPINNSVVRLTWKRPKFTPGISFYTIRYRTVQMDNIKPEPNATYIKHVVTNDNDTLVRYITGLAPFTLAEFSIRTHTHNSYGAFSYAVRCRTGEGKPSAPRNLQLTLVSPRLAELSWQPPEKRNGIIVEYIINYKESNNGDSWMIQTENGSVTATQVDNLELDSEYLFKLRAKTTAGVGQVSQVQKLTTSSGRGTDKPHTGQPGESREQRMDIIIGVSIAGTCIAICVILIVFRFCVPRAAAARDRPGSGTPPDSTLPVHFNGTYMPNVNGNRYIGNATGMTMTEGHELDTLTPMLPPLVENENSDSKGGYGMVNGTVMTGLRVQCMPNGRIATFLDNQDSHVKRPQAKIPPIGNGTNNTSSAVVADCQPDISRNDPPMEFSCSHPDDSGSNDQGDNDTSVNSSLERTSTSSQSQASKQGPSSQERPDTISELTNAQEPHPQHTKNTPSRASHDRQQQIPTTETTVNASSRQDCEEGEGDMDTGGEESEASCLLSHHQEPSALPHSSHSCTHHQSSLREHASSPPQSRLVDSGHIMPNDADTSGTPLLSESQPDDSILYSKNGSPTHGTPSSTSSHA